MVGILARLGARGVTVLLSIHQPRPDILRLMDRTLILSATGEIVYSGAAINPRTRHLVFHGPHPYPVRHRRDRVFRCCHNASTLIQLIRSGAKPPGT